MDLTVDDFAANIGSTEPVAVVGLGTRAMPPADVRLVNAPVEYSALIPLLQRQVLCVDTTASTPSTLR